MEDENKKIKIKTLEKSVKYSISISVYIYIVNYSNRSLFTLVVFNSFEF